MKLTVKKLTQIIREEVENTLQEARYYTPGGKDYPFNQKYADDPVMASDRGASDEGWDDSPVPDFEPEPKKEPKHNAESTTILKFIQGLDGTDKLASFSDDHWKALAKAQRSIRRDTEDENRDLLAKAYSAAAKQFDREERIIMNDIGAFLDFYKRYGMPRGFKEL